MLDFPFFIDCLNCLPSFTEIPFKIIILDEADEMTTDAQTALRRIIEDTAKICRFILIANNYFNHFEIVF